MSPLVCPALDRLPRNTPADTVDKEVAYFKAIPWVAPILADPTTIPFVAPGRNPRSPKHDQLFGHTLAHERCVPHFLCTFQAESKAAALDPQRPILKIVTLAAVGDGVSGYPNVVHGGLVASLIDEAMGVIFELNGTLKKDLPQFKGDTMTAGLDIKYLRPVRTNRVLRITAAVEEMNGRKSKVSCEVTDETGEILAKCSSLWISLKYKAQL